METIVFIDGQNLYHRARDAWAPDPPVQHTPYSWPSYDVEKLAAWIIRRVPGRVLKQIRFYTGVPNSSGTERNRFWHGFWTNKLRHLRNRGVYVYTGHVNPGGQEKGVDVSLAIDLIQLTHERSYDTAVIVSQDWDFGPAVRLARKIAHGQGRALDFESVFPLNPQNRRGVPGTTWIHIDQRTYDSFYDPTEFRPR